LRERGCTFQGEIEMESEETHFPREIELKGRRGAARGGAHISREREGMHPKEKFSIYEQYRTDLRAGCTSFIAGRTTG
jgi:hypothetical protein